MGTARPDDLAREMGINFSTEKPAQSKMAVLRFTIKLPPMPSDPKKGDESPEVKTYAEAVQKVTRWAAKVKPWTFITGDPRPIVAAELTWGNRWKVGVVNRASKRALKAFWSDEAQARRLALSQPTPEQGITVLDGTPKKERATKELREQLVRAATIIAGPGTVRDLEPNVVVDPAVMQ